MDRVPLLYRSRETVLVAVQHARTLFPFPILGIDTDNGGEFLNEELVHIVNKNTLRSREGVPIRKEISVLLSKRMERLCVRLLGMIASLGNTPIGNSPNFIEQCACMSTASSPR